MPKLQLTDRLQLLATYDKPSPQLNVRIRMSPQFLTHKFATVLTTILLTTASTALHAADPITPSDKLPKTSPWDLKKLSEPPAFEWIDAKSPVRSMYYAGEPFHGRPTRVFAYYASPATLKGKMPKKPRYPGIVLLHGGGGTAFRD